MTETRATTTPTSNVAATLRDETGDHAVDPRHLNMLYMLENNGVYGLTKGQFSASARTWPIECFPPYPSASRC